MEHDREPDDSGLPQVDVVIPDDARELVRDVQAYHRELRARRRRERWHRLGRALRRRDVTAPLLVGLMLIAVLSATLLVLGSGTAGRPRDGDQPRVPAPETAPPGSIGGPLPDSRVAVNGESRALRTLRPAAIAAVPRQCNCGAELQRLADRAGQYGIPVYLARNGIPTAGLQRLAGELDAAGRPAVLGDSNGGLAATYDISGLGIILVSRDGRVDSVIRDLGPDMSLDRQLAPLLER